MAYFLKTTGPVKEPPVKGARSKRISSAMRIFKGSSRRPSESLTAAHMRLNEVISEEKEELELETQATEKASHTSRKPLISPEPSLPEVVVPKISKTGKKYFEIEPVRARKEKQGSASKNPQIAESRVSVLVTDQLSTDSLHDWVLGFEGAKTDTKPQEHEGPEALRGWPIKRISQTLPHEETIRVLDRKIVAPSKTGSSKPLELIDAMVKASQQNTSRRRLRRARPEGPRPLDLGGSHLQGSIERDQRLDGYCTSPLSMKRTNSIGDLSENYRIIATTASPSPRISHPIQEDSTIDYSRTPIATPPKRAAAYTACEKRSPL
ncbi:hypothetical protein D6D26_02699 [Aureobasidium pullulans]|nr:hypothetical protein D6D26_02699 [Aureobasidium pullulans]